MDISEARKHDLFSCLDETQWAAVSIGAVSRRFEAGAILFQTGEPASAYFFVQEGNVKLLRRSVDGHEQVIEVIEPHQIFAEALVVEGSTYPVDAVAVQRVRLICFESPRLREVLLSSPNAALKLVSKMLKHLHGLVATVHALTLESAAERVAGFILAKAGPDDVFVLPYPKHVLASRLGITPESLSRALTQLKKRGLVSVDGSEFRVLDRNHLRSFH